MKAGCLTRKRIWEVDCWSLDLALAASFDWRELINLLQGHGHSFDSTKPGSALELQAQCLIHEYCHSDNPVSIKLESFLNGWHRETIDLLDSWSPSQVTGFVLTDPWSKQYGFAGIFWALASDPREGFDCIRRRFHQRFQIFSARSLNVRS